MIQKIDSNKFSLTILKVTTFSRIRQSLFIREASELDLAPNFRRFNPFLAPNFRRFDSFLAPNFRRFNPFLALNFRKIRIFAPDYQRVTNYEKISKKTYRQRT